MENVQDIIFQIVYLQGTLRVPGTGSDEDFRGSQLMHQFYLWWRAKNDLITETRYTTGDIP